MTSLRHVDLVYSAAVRMTCGDTSWVKVYAFADGHTQARTETDGSFDKFETEHSSAAQP